MRLVSAALVSLLLVSASLPARAQDPTVQLEPRSHDTEEWANIAAHMPNPATATPAQLEVAGDVLRARRYPQDAMSFYNAALAHGADKPAILNKMGITCLEAQQVVLARIFFQRVVKLDKRNASAWNNLGAADFTLHNTQSSVGDYKHALKLKKTSAPFHSNLALAYFELKDSDDGRKELARALRLDPDLLHRSNSGGYTAQVLATANYSEICFEMARIYATQHNIPAMLDWLTKASERGYDVRAAMDRDGILRPLLADPRIVVILKNTASLRANNKLPANTPVPSLGPVAH